MRLRLSNALECCTLCVPYHARQLLTTFTAHFRLIPSLLRRGKSANQPQLPLTDASFGFCVRHVSVSACVCVCVSITLWLPSTLFQILLFHSPSVSMGVCALGFDITCAASWQIFVTAALNWILTFLCMHIEIGGHRKSHPWCSAGW